MTKYDAESIIQRELEPSERLIWFGVPDPRMATLASFAIYLFAIPWTGFAVFWMAMAMGIGSAARRESSGPGGMFALFGLPFVLIGLGMMSAPYWVWRSMLNTVYAVTSQRVIIISGSMTRRVQSFAGKQLGPIERTEKADGSGTLTLARSWSGNSNNNSRQMTLVQFQAIPEVRRVERLIRETLLDPAKNTEKKLSGDSTINSGGYSS